MLYIVASIAYDYVRVHRTIMYRVLAHNYACDRTGDGST